MAENRRHANELKEKRAKLEELRRARDERKALLAQAEKGGSSQTLTSSRKDVNDLVDSLLSSTRPSTPGPSSTSRQASTSTFVPPSKQTGSTPSTSLPGTPGGRDSRLSNDEMHAMGRAQPSGLEQPAEHNSSLSAFAAPVDYIDHSAELYELPTKPKPPAVTYSKAIQTSSISTTTSDVELQISDDELGSRRRQKGTVLTSGRETEDEMRSRILEELETEKRELELELQELKRRLGEQREISDLSNEQRQAIYSAPEFSTFIEESTRIVQRALSDNYDYIKDYTISADTDYDASEGQTLKLFCGFSDDRWTSGRSITDLDWSPKFHELVVASYNKNPSAPNDPDGVVAVWNLHLLERPEFIFHSPSDVVSVTFSPHHPTLIFGGSYSGQILLWDTRAKHLPVLKTPLSASGHTYPIYAMKMVGTQNANNLITSSTDGLVCSWLADMLAQPQEALPLSISSHNKTDEVSITALDFPDNETATFWLGTEEGSVYQANRFDRASAKAGLNAVDVYRGHAGPITGLHFHPSSGGIDFSDLFLTSSVDWTVKLWRSKAATGGTGVASAPSQNTAKQQGSAGVSPLHSFEDADDYVFDAKWHPNHPAVFGTVDGSGKFSLWNLNQDTEVPVVSTPVSTRAINKLAFDRSPLSRKAALGSSDGKLYVYDIAEALVAPREKEWVEFQKTVQALSQSGKSAFGNEPTPIDTGSRYRTSLI